MGRPVKKPLLAKSTKFPAVKGAVKPSAIMVMLPRGFELEGMMLERIGVERGRFVRGRVIEKVTRARP